MSNSQGTSGENLLRKVHLVIDHLVHDGKVVARSDNSVNDIFPVAINEAQGEALRNWVIKEKAVHTIEIGLAWGIGALYICEGLLTNDNPNIHHIAIDPFQHHFKDCGLQSLDEAGVLQFVKHLKGESQIILPQFVNEGRQFDFAFVDGSHLFDRVFLDLIYLGRLVRPGGIIFADDYQAPAVAKAVSFCLTNLGWKLEEVAPSSERHRWVVLRTIEEPIHRMYPHFVEF